MERESHNGEMLVSNVFFGAVLALLAVLLSGMFALTLAPSSLSVVAAPQSGQHAQTEVSRPGRMT